MYYLQAIYYGKQTKLFSSFQHHDLFKRTNHFTQSYRKMNSMISDRMRTQGKTFFVLLEIQNC